MTEQPTSVEQFAAIDPIPTLESIAPEVYSEDATYYRCPVCGARSYSVGQPDDYRPMHDDRHECDGPIDPVSRLEFLENDPEVLALLADAQRAWYEARGLEQPE